MTVESPQRGAIPTPRDVLAAATPHAPLVGAPPNFIIVPQRISSWGNYDHGDCVTAEEAFAKACSNPEVFISDDEAIAWATKHNALNGAVIANVLKWMQDDGFPNGSGTYDDGPYLSVNWTDSTILQSAISQGPVKIGVASHQLEAAWRTTNGKTGWFGIGFQPDSHEDHCVSLCGYGTIYWLAQQLNVPIPESNIHIDQLGYAMFTWNSIGIVDEPSLLAITHEAWLRQPTTIMKGVTKTLLVPGQSLQPGQSLRSPNQLHTLTLQTDGNVVLYNQQSQPCWSTKTEGITARTFIMQTDGNLVLYDTDNCPKWASHTDGNPGAFCDIQDDGNVVVYRAGSQTQTPDNALWAASND